MFYWAYSQRGENVCIYGAVGVRICISLLESIQQKDIDMLERLQKCCLHLASSQIYIINTGRMGMDLVEIYKYLNGFHKCGHHESTLRKLSNHSAELYQPYSRSIFKFLCCLCDSKIEFLAWKFDSRCLSLFMDGLRTCSREKKV